MVINQNVTIIFQQVSLAGDEENSVAHVLTEIFSFMDITLDTVEQNKKTMQGVVGLGRINAAVCMDWTI